MSPGDAGGRSPFTAVAVTSAVVMFIVTGLLAVFCVVAGCSTRRRRVVAPPLKPAPRHLVIGSGSTALYCGRPTTPGSNLRQTLPVAAVRPPSLYQTVYSDAVCPTMKSSSWASTAVPLSQLWSASQLGSRHASSSRISARQIQPITLHYYNDF